MGADQVIEFAMSLRGAIEDHPFGPKADVYKVGGRMFAFLWLDGDAHRINLKCAPERALEYRDEFDAVTPGYHMNKRHWNTVRLEGDVPAGTLREMIRHSYDLVVAKLPKDQRESLA